MAEYKQTEWSFSNVKFDDEAVFTDGPKTVKILSAEYNDENADEAKRYTYNLRIQCIEEGPCEGATANLRYWLKDKKTAQDNKNTIGWLCSLGKAIFAEESTGVPAPCDIIGAVCIADIKMKDSEDGRKYPRVYHFMPASDDFALYSDIKQYFRKVVPAPKAV